MDYSEYDINARRKRQLTIRSMGACVFSMLPFIYKPMDL